LAASLGRQGPAEQQAPAEERNEREPRVGSQREHVPDVERS
jgi:hypothetical protein